MNAPILGPSGRPATDASSVTRPRARRGLLGWFIRGGWYPFLIAPSLGLLSFVPFVHAALRLRRPVAWLWAVLYAGAVVALLKLAGTEYTSGFALVFWTLMIGGTVHSLVLRRQVWPSNADAQAAPAEPEPADLPADPAVSAVLAARARRDESRRLAAADPLMARELRIGRPDLPRTYDDGGLVDLNSAPVEAIAGMCGIEPAVAAQIVDTRTGGITFTTVDDVFSCTDIPFPLWDRIRDRAVVING